jgi:long-subunit acyl-CoA synthetase (AMP-forming)
VTADFRTELFVQLRGMGERPVLREGTVTTRARELMRLAGGARAFLRRAGIGPGARVAVIGENSVRWVAVDLALLFEGAVAVPFYARQAPAELAAMLRDAEPSLVLCGDEALLAAVEGALGPGDGPRMALLTDTAGDEECLEPVPRAPDDVVRIVYTSGTSGPAKGVLLTAGNVGFMLARTTERIGELMRGAVEPERVFHYLPCCFAASWILLQSVLARGGMLVFCTDLKKLVADVDGNPQAPGSKGGRDLRGQA